MLDFPSQSGLTSDEAERRLARFGPNRLPEPKSAGPALIFLSQFLSPFIYILLVAAAVSLAVGQIPSAAFILVVLLLNATIGTVQEYSAARSASALRQMIAGTAHVVRDGTVQAVVMDEVVPGDLVLLYPGNRVPADVRLIASRSLQIDESMLTGESLAVTKSAGVDIGPEAPLSERINGCFAGTIVTSGRGQGVVQATGLQTEVGNIAREVTRQRVSEPPLIIRIRKFTYWVAAAIAIAIGLAVSTIPEGLPAALTVALAIGMRRMARHNVIIRKLVAVEALGSCTFLCSDKTGTDEIIILVLDNAGWHVPAGTSRRGSNRPRVSSSPS